MLPTLAGWTSARSDAYDVVLSPKDDAGTCLIRYRERTRPLRTLGEVVRRYVRGLPTGATVDTISAPCRFTTAEGEHGGVVTMDTVYEGRRQQHSIAVLPVDEFYALTVGIAVDPTDFARVGAAVLELARRDWHFLTTRRRRFPFLAPEEFAVRAVGRTRAFLSPDRALELVVPLAEPLNPRLTPMACVQAHLDASPGSWLVGSADGSTFELAVPRPDGTAFVRLLTVLRDARYAYTLHVDAPATHGAQARALLDETARSVRMLFPHARGTCADLTDALSHWLN